MVFGSVDGFGFVYIARFPPENHVARVLSQPHRASIINCGAKWKQIQ